MASSLAIHRPLKTSLCSISPQFGEKGEPKRWTKKVNQPGLEITSSVWEVVFNTNQVSSPVHCGSWQMCLSTGTTERAVLERNERPNAEWSPAWATLPPKMCMPPRCYRLLMLLLLCTQGLPIAHTLQNLFWQCSGICTLNTEKQQLLCIYLWAECVTEKAAVQMIVPNLAAVGSPVTFFPTYHFL